MKITEDDYNLLKRNITKVLRDNHIKLTEVPNMRTRWDIFHKTPYNSNLYNYLNDDNIDTALRRIYEEEVNK